MNSLSVQWFRLHASTARGKDSIPGGGIKILHATWHGKKKKNRGWGGEERNYYTTIMIIYYYCY